tara:strand:+ start:8969 stop:9307 length:339 start_codon:yes stop_codon:yes gene_type:complete
MKNRPENRVFEGRISRDRFVEDEYEEKTKAEIKTLKHYFSKEWFDKSYLTYVNIKRSRLIKRTSNFPLQKCPACNKTWNIYIKQKNSKKLKTVQYWSDFKRLPKSEVICPNC